MCFTLELTSKYKLSHSDHENESKYLKFVTILNVNKVFEMEY